MSPELSLFPESSPFRVLLNYLGTIIALLGLFCLIPLAVIPFYPEEAGYAACFLLPGLVSVTLGNLLRQTTQSRDRPRLERHQDAVLVVAVWVSAILICAMPYLLTGDYNFVQSVFESTSGFTTTGLSVVDVTRSPHIVLFFRSLTLFLGGVGLVLVFVSILSDRYGWRLFSAEGHGDRLMPNLIRSARLVLSIYVLYIVLGIVAYTAFGMGLFDALNHSIAAVSTGGFSTKADSIGAYHSLGIEIVTIVLMLLGNTNFLIHVKLLQGKIRDVFRHGEVRFLLVLIFLSLPLFILGYRQTGAGWGESFRIGLFQLISAVTTTGFQTVPNFLGLSGFLTFLFVLLMLIGAGIGSTGGGIKQQRVLLFFKSLWWSLRDALVPQRRILGCFLNRAGEKTRVSLREILDTNAFVGLYLGLFVLGTLVFAAHGHPLGESMFEFASSLGTVGLSNGITGFSAPPAILWTSIAGMFCGRLEINVVLFSIARGVSHLSRKGK